MASRPVIFDTNIWLDFFLHRSQERADEAKEVIERMRGDFDKPLVVTTSIKKDVYYLIQRDLKHRLMCANSTNSLTEAQSLAVRDLAWTMLEEMDELATIVPESMREDFFARHLRGVHDDYEDDLLIGTAQAIDAQMVVTYDEGLLRHFPELCATPESALERLA